MMICSHGCVLCSIEIDNIQTHFEENLKNRQIAKCQCVCQRPGKKIQKVEPTALASPETPAQQSSLQQINQKRRRCWRHGADADEENVCHYLNVALVFQTAKLDFLITFKHLTMMWLYY